MKKLSPKNKQDEKSIEERYQKKSQREHILLRPDSYVGDITPQNELLWIYDKLSMKMIKKNILYVPGLYKIYDEILLNARDHTFEDETCDTIKVSIDKNNSMIEIWNNGIGIPVVMHKDHNILIPELVFGELLTSSNFDDTEERVTGGRNGFGAKLANIYSTEFIVETADTENGKKFIQTFKNNMSERTKPKITTLSENSKSYTKISFKPDLQKFGITELSDDLISLFHKRVFDISACCRKKVKVFFNDEKLDVPNFKKYIDLYYSKEEAHDENQTDELSGGLPNETEIQNDNDSPQSDAESATETEKEYKMEIIFEEPNNRWRVGVIYIPDNGFEQISFVNGICTYKGGNHVDYVVSYILSQLDAQIKKKYPDLGVKPGQLKENLVIFVDAIIVNPSFDSQIKDYLKTKPVDFGSTCELTDRTINKISKSGILDQVISIAKFKEEQKFLKATDGKKETNIRGIPKLEDANKAGGKESHLCYLILTEGDSAKAFAMSGRAVIPNGYDHIGVFPLRGKLLNVRDKPVKKYMNNEEIKHIKQILGLKQNVEYTDTKQLRYGGIIILTDQDLDGFHIKGLLINFIHFFWPSLLKNNEFIHTFETEIVKAKKGKEILSFYNLADYYKWKNTDDSKGWNIKYYKGLGTHTPDEAKQCFINFKNKLIKFVWKQNTTNNENSDMIDENDDAILLAFAKKRENARKEWLSNYDINDISNTSEQLITYPDFIHKELKHFSNSDNIRSIPSICDGQKPSQRKIMFSAFKRNLVEEVRVAQFAGYVSEHSGYHHGETSLHSTIIGLAQDFVGANNINLLEPIGQFGTRLLGGDDHASPRYIHTKLNPLTYKIYRKEDFDIMDYLDDDGSIIEPKWYAPIIPMLLVNGSNGIGTGFSTKIPCYNPIDIVNNLYNLMDNKQMNEMNPWYHHFKGTLTNLGNGYEISGLCNQIDDDTVSITELPIGLWTTPYKNFLEGLIYDKKSKSGIILDKKEYNSDYTVNFVLKFPENRLIKFIMNDSLKTRLKLIKTISTSNMYAYDATGKLKKYNSPLEIIQEFYNMRLNIYIKRKEYLIGKFNRELDILKYRKLFVENVAIKKTIIVLNKSKSDIAIQLNKLKFPVLSLDQNKEGSYDYLLEMTISSLTEDKIKEIQHKYDNKEKELAELQATNEIQMWKNELKELMDQYIPWLRTKDEYYNDSIPGIKKKPAKKPAKKQAK